MDLDEPIVTAGVGLGLAALRWWALLQMQVLWRACVGPWWTVVAALLAIALAVGGLPGPGVAVVPQVDPWLAAGAELMLGAGLGLVVALPGHALLGAAQTSARVLGTAPGPWRMLTVALVGTTALTLGLHRPLLLGAQGLLDAWPIGAPQAWAEGISEIPVAQLAHGTTVLALALVTPVLLVAVVAELGTRLVARGGSTAAPVVDGLAPWLRVAAALTATGASWAAYDAIWAGRALGLPG
ncbi:MAG: hypothetical protein K0V04_08135 [Deltaproteobacteria bacterium]|nr:hypothetical protein [Deltaproteobacteria bacterium]